jgi:hypothetical protein
VVIKITIKINGNDQVFTTRTYTFTDDKTRITFRDKFGNLKNFSAAPEILVGIEETRECGF